MPQRQSRETAIPWVFLSVEGPLLHKSCGQTCAYTPRTPTPPPPPAIFYCRKFDWTVAQMSTDSPSLSADLAHGSSGKQAHGPRSKRRPRPHCSPCPALHPKKTSLYSSVGTRPRLAQQQSWRQCCAVTASFGKVLCFLFGNVAEVRRLSSWN